MADAKHNFALSDGEYISTPFQSVQAGSPYRSPARSLSPQSARRPRSDTDPSIPPNARCYDEPDSSAELTDVVHDDKISPLDPRRFTPTLHASLVSEILALRREVETQHREIESLESALDSTRTDNDALNSNLSKTVKEGRSLKKQMELLETGTLSALEELSKQRDEAVISATDLKKRLDQNTKKAKSHEENAEKTQMLWNRDRDNWETERRNMERKVHIVEGRLKVVLDQVSAANAVNAARAQKRAEVARPSSRASKHHRKQSDASSVYSVSTRRERSRSSSPSVRSYSFTSRRSSEGSLRPIPGDLTLSQQSLAQELAEEQADYDSDQSEKSVDSIGELQTGKPTGSKAHADRKARKILGLSIEHSRPNSIGPGAALRKAEEATHVSTVEETTADRPQPLRANYSDAAIQYSPPCSPLSPPLPEKSARRSRTSGSELEDRGRPGNDANQSRKRISVNIADTPAKAKASNDYSSDQARLTSSSSQTLGDLPSPPWTPSSPTSLYRLSMTSSQNIPVTSSSTQTDELARSVPEMIQPSEADVEVPVIAIHPPDDTTSLSLSRGNTVQRKSVALPPRTRSASSQVIVTELITLRSTSTQTNEIRTDPRMKRLPPTLRPSLLDDSRISGRTTTAESRIPTQRDNQITAPPIVDESASPPPILLRRNDRNDGSMDPCHRRNNVNAPLPSPTQTGVRQPSPSGLDEEDHEKPESNKAEEDTFSDDDFFNRPMVTYTLKSGKLVSKASNPRLEDLPTKPDDTREPEIESEFEVDGESAVRQFNSQQDIRSRKKAGKQPAARRIPSKRLIDTHGRVAESIPEDSALQQPRSRSPSAPELPNSGFFTAAKPPFPVPTRHSSRKIPLSGSERSMSPTPVQGNGRYPAYPHRTGNRHASVRKSRSTAALKDEAFQEHRRSGSRSTTQSSAFPDSPDVFSMPFSDLSSMKSRNFGRQGQRSDYSATYTQSREEASVASVQSTTVVDAIAQTMVGEWMFKYVARRKSFGRDSGMPWDQSKSPEEVSANINTNSVRHKRWVWIAPYERAVMWSSKQPTSGSALLGKTGRKLVIQSVLDVKDDSPLPKGTEAHMNFGRSILILTPQRALKFTAMTQERHYVWLTALSFLSHSSLVPEDLGAFPPTPKEESMHYPPPLANRHQPKTRPNMNPLRAFTTGSISQNAIPKIDLHHAPDLDDAADPPNVPRYSAHARKRSNTGPRPTPGAFRSFSSNIMSPTLSINAAMSETHSMSSIGIAASKNSNKSVSSRRTSEASGRSSNNAFDPTGTVRMEAFVAPAEPRPRGSYRTKQGWKKDKNYWTGGGGPDLDFHDRRQEQYMESTLRNDDPFTGF